MPLPIPSMYGIFTYIYHKNQPDVGKYTIDAMGLGNESGASCTNLEAEKVHESFLKVSDQLFTLPLAVAHISCLKY